MEFPGSNLETIDAQLIILIVYIDAQLIILIVHDIHENKTRLAKSVHCINFVLGGIPKKKKGG